MRICGLWSVIPFVFMLLGGCEPAAPTRSAGSGKHIYTKHARCRMECRSITETEVDEVLASGHVNAGKSDPDDKPCPTEAVEGRSSEGQAIRVVVARCEGVDKIVTVIDTETEHDVNCHCR